MADSPCIAVCSIDDKNGYCAGCYRSLEEIANWTTYNSMQKHDILLQTQKRKQNQAFTMLEISIVIALIALLTATITVGAEYIRDARMLKQMSQIERVQSGINLFKEKFQCFPGDCPDPDTIDGGSNRGDGNNYLGSTWTNSENIGFWQHLKKSGMIQDDLATNTVIPTVFTPSPVLYQSGVLAVIGSVNSAQNVMVLASPDLVGFASVREAIFLDEKMDDGLAASGSLQTTGYGSAGSVFSEAAVLPTSTSNYTGSNRCITSGEYDGFLTGAAGRCNMVYIFDR